MVLSLSLHSSSSESEGGIFPTVDSSSSLSSGYADCFLNCGGLGIVSRTDNAGRLGSVYQ